ncbi:MAG TPA: sulfatase-like hydrolase/transferase [Flavisolibacter sp.]|nr:sulfatase-like hydrolase/transferase [Flavisolibacter sp.]
MTKIIRLLKWPSLLLLLPVIFLWHGYNENFGLLPLRTLAGLLLEYALVVVIFFLVAYLLLREGRRAFLFSFAGLAVYFLFGAFHDWIKAVLNNGFFSSYSFLLPSMLVLAIALVRLLRNSGRKWIRASNYCRWLLVLLLLIEVGTTVYQRVAEPYGGHSLLPDQRLAMPVPDNRHLPDIYFVVFDEYASSKALREAFDFDNSLMDSLLTSKGFFLSHNSSSNYNYTLLSLASTFGLSYLDLKEDGMVFNQPLSIRAYKAIGKNGLLRYLSAQGYALRNFGCFDLEGAPAPTYAYLGDDFFEKMVNTGTLSCRIKQDILWNFTAKNIFTGVPNFEPLQQERKKFLDRNQYNYEALMKELKTAHTGPRFVYCHLMLPHPPYYLDEKGALQPDTMQHYNRHNKDAYLHQLRYANRLIGEIVNAAVQKTGRPRVVILEGDHGYRFYSDKASWKYAFMNLNSYYFSDGDYRGLYDGISPVNSFRLVLNKYFGQKLSMLPDTAFYLLDPDDYR